MMVTRRREWRGWKGKEGEKERERGFTKGIGLEDDG
jgi:hypothetical protein